MSDNQQIELQQILDMLLLSGYFRARVSALSNFDKILGGLSWLLALKNVDVDLDYDDEFSIGQKIKLCEKIVKALKALECPIQILPHQIQGLDSSLLLPLFKWLINTAFIEANEKKLQTQAMTKMKFLSTLNIKEDTRNDFLLEIRESKKVDRRIRKNPHTSIKDSANPVTIYSDLLEFDDISSFPTYLKLVNKDYSSTSATSTSTSESNNPKANNIDYSKPTLSKRKTTELDQDTIQKEFATKVNTQFHTLDKRGTKIIGNAIMQLLSTERENFSAEILEAENNAKELDIKEIAKNEIYSKALENKNLKNLLEKQIIQKKNLASQIQEKESKLDQLLSQIQHLETNKKEILEMCTNIDKDLQTSIEKKSHNEVHNLIEMRESLQNRRSETKSLAKKKFENLQKELADKERLLEDFKTDPEIEKEIIKKEENWKKIKEEQIEMNKELVKYERKIENIPSNFEIAQYHKRIMELFELVNLEMDSYREIYSSVNQRQNIVKLATNQIELIRSLKSALAETKKKKDKENLINNMLDALKGMKDNLKQSDDKMSKTASLKLESQKEYKSIVKFERDYHKLLRDLKTFS